MAHPNEEVVRRGFAAFAAGDLDAVRGLFAPDAVWHVPGHNPLAGSHKGVEEVMGFLGKSMALSGGTFTTDVHDVVGNDEHVFAAYAVSAERPGKSLRDTAVLVCHVRDGLVTEVWGLSGDQHLVDQFWS